MEDFYTLAQVVIPVVLLLVFIEGILSIDNAAVIAAMANKLPDDVMAPWPLQWLGVQRTAALKAGLLGAFVGRGLMLLIAGVIIKFPVIHTIGAAYLLLIVLEHFTGFNPLKWIVGLFVKSDPTQVKATSFWGVVIGIEIADLIFSIDNVIAAVAISPNLWVVMLGVGLGIVTMRFAAVAFQWVLVRISSMEHGAYLLILAIAGELLLEQYSGIHLTEIHTFLISFAILCGVVIYHYAIVAPREKLHPHAHTGTASIEDELADEERILENPSASAN